MPTGQATTRATRTRTSTASMILTALGVLVAVGVTIAALALTGADHRHATASLDPSTSLNGRYVYIRADKAYEQAARTGGSQTAAPQLARHAYIRQDKSYQPVP